MLRWLRREGGWQPRRPDAGSVVDDVSRARFWSSPGCSILALEWLARLPQTTSAEELESCQPPPTVTGLSTALQEAGLQPLVCDLTERLPAGVRADGWNVCKAVVVGHQVLRMNEAHAWTWNLPRLQTLAERWGRPCEPTPLPQPLVRVPAAPVSTPLWTPSSRATKAATAQRSTPTSPER